MEENNNGSRLIVLIMVIAALTGVGSFLARRPSPTNQPTKPIEVSDQAGQQPSIMELSAIEHKDTVKYPENGYTLRTITVEAYIYADCANESCRPSIMEADGPHFTLGIDSNIDDSNVGSTFVCMLKRDDTGFTSGITVGECIQRQPICPVRGGIAPSP